MIRAARQYEALKFVPLIKSPSLRVPKPIDLPHDIHPLPADIEEYFRYPFTLEPHVLAMESSRQATVAAHAARREAYLQAREEAKRKRKRDVLHRVAPGFEPEKGVLQPTRNLSKASTATTTIGQDQSLQPSEIDRLAEQLDKLGNK